MPNASDICVIPVSSALRPALLGLAVAPEQDRFVGKIADLLADAATCPDAWAMAVLWGGAPIGFYRVESGARSVTGAEVEIPTRGIRCFFIAARWQRRGLGALALQALISDIRRRDLATRQMVLAVDDDNQAARKLYLAAGFIHRGTLYHGPEQAPQHLLWRDLSRT